MAGKAATALKIQKIRARAAYHKNERKLKRLSNKSNRDGDDDMAHNSVVPAANGERKLQKNLMWLP